jgi:hypothetical protein
MKKLVLTGVLIASGILASFNAIAQRGVQLGVEGIPQLSWLANKNDKDNGAIKYLGTFRGAAGITSQFNWSDNWGIGLNVDYSWQGQRFKYAGIERFKQVDYVKIPLMLVYNSDPSRNVMFLAKLGPELNILSRARLTDKDGNLIADQKPAYLKSDLGGLLSLGLQYNISDHLILETSLRGDMTFNNAEDTKYAYNINDPIGKLTGNMFRSPDRAKTVSTTLGFVFGLKYAFTSYNSTTTTPRPVHPRRAGGGY